MCNQEILCSCSGEEFLWFIASRCTKEREIWCIKFLKGTCVWKSWKKSIKSYIAYGLFCVSTLIICQFCYDKCRGKGWAVMSGGDHGSAWCTKMFNFTVLELSFAVEVSECFVLECLYEYRVCIVVCIVPVMDLTTINKFDFSRFFLRYLFALPSKTI